MIQTIPLNKLALSPNNVRKTNRDEDIRSLADDIHSRGLKQNLVVTERPDKKGHYEVDAGGRRFQALDLNAALGRIPKNHPVPCLIEERDQALETSLAENLHRVAMNPADEFEAFAAIISRYGDSGITDRAEQVANCARRFGVTVRHVEQRLRLAALAPDILDALREGRITLEAAKAYAAHPDQKLQLQIFKDEERKPGDWRHGAKSIRDRIAGKVYAVDHRLVRLVGLEAYAAAGGRVAPDLFLGSEDREVLLDPAIIDRLSRELGGAEAGRRAKDDGWLDGALNLSTYAWGLPKTPEGFQVSYNGGASLPPERRLDAIAIYDIAEDGSLVLNSSCFVPAQVRPPAPAYEPETREEYWARHRREEIERIALRLAAPKMAGTPLEGRAFWPRRDDDYVEQVQKIDEATFLVALLVKVAAVDADAAMAQAEAQYEREQAELAEEDQAAADAAASGEAEALSDGALA